MKVKLFFKNENNNNWN